MSINAVEKYSFRGLSKDGPLPHFEVRSVRLDTYCVANENEVSEYYKIYWIEDGNGEYEVDFQSISIQGAGIFCLSPGQIFTVRNEQVRSGYQISFDREFYCVETHGKEIACNGVLFNNVHRATMIPLQNTDALFFRNIIDQLIAELKTARCRPSGHTGNLSAVISHSGTTNMGTQKSAPKEEETNHLAADFIALVEKNHPRIHAVSEYAQMLFVSPKSLAKRLKILGYPTPTEIIHNRIILQAKRELRYTRKSVKEIAFDLGFEDPAYFLDFSGRKRGFLR